MYCSSSESRACSPRSSRWSYSSATLSACAAGPRRCQYSASSADLAEVWILMRRFCCRRASRRSPAVAFTHRPSSRAKRSTPQSGATFALARFSNSAYRSSFAVTASIARQKFRMRPGKATDIRPDQYAVNPRHVFSCVGMGRKASGGVSRIRSYGDRTNMSPIVSATPARACRYPVSSPRRTRRIVRLKYFAFVAPSHPGAPSGCVGSTGESTTNASRAQSRSASSRVSGSLALEPASQVPRCRATTR